MRFTFPPESPLHQFTEDELTAIFAAGRQREYLVDEVILTEGQTGDSMFFVLEGYAGARLDSGAMSRSYSPGNYFGELSFINPGHLRSTTILATSKVRVLIVDQTSVQSLLATYPRIVYLLLRRACVFLIDAERNLIADLRRKNADLRETLAQLDFTRMRLTQEELTSRTDFLTGLTNRRGFDAELPALVNRAHALGFNLGLVVIDLDEFKAINDTFGHAAGDTVLKTAGAVLQRGLGRTEFACRFGGDEFVLLLVDRDEAGVRERAEIVRAAIAQMPHPGTDRGLRITATLGGTLLKPEETPETLLKRADDALYAAKRSGRDQLGWL